MCERFLLSSILFDEFFWCFDGVVGFVAFGFETEFVVYFALDGLLVFLAFAHDVSEDVLFAG